MTRDAPDLVLLGNLLVDDIVLRDGRTLMGEPGGAMVYASLAARLWGVRVGLVTVAGADYPSGMLETLRARGVELEGVRHLGRPGVRTWLLHEPGARRVVHHLGRPTHFEVSPVLADIPAAWSGARAFHLSPMPIDRQRELVTGLATRRASAGATAEQDAPLVSVDPHESIREENLESWRSVLHHADAFFPSQDEMRLGADPDPSLDTLGGIAGPRLRFIAMKRGEHGGMLDDRHERRRVAWAARAERFVDPTGAGDAFAGGFLAGLLRARSIERAVEQGVVSASFAVEDWGSRALCAATREQAVRRCGAWLGGADEV